MFSSIKGFIGSPVLNRVINAGSGADQRPGRGSELLRRRLACHDSSRSWEGLGDAGIALGISRVDSL